MTSSPIPVRAALIVPLLLATLLLTACSSAAPAGPSAAAASSAPAASSASASSGTTAAPADASGPSVTVKTGDELCKLVSVADAQAAERSEPAFDKQAGTTGSYDDPVCSYENSAAFTNVSVLIYPHGIVQVDTAKSYLNQTGATPLSGVGMKASVSEHEVDVDLGGGFTLIAYQPTDIGKPRAGVTTAAGLTALAKAFVAKLG